MSVPAWMMKGECAHQPDLFAANPMEPVSKRTRQAKEICETRCPVYHDCLAYIAVDPQPVMIWAGMRPVEQQDFANMWRKLYGEPASPGLNDPGQGDLLAGDIDRVGA